MYLEKFFYIDQLVRKVNLFKKDNKIIGFTNGCFDLLHDGHLFLISNSRLFCDYLIIGLNSDLSVKNLKGKDRPIDNQNKRILKLSKLNDVDAIILFSENTPFETIEKLKPDILFKGSDYLEKKIIGADIVINNGGKIKLIDILPGYSTTKIVNDLNK